ncbi:MAG TPA: succinate dehydrogenase cytochrome b subunit [Acidimicrobiia bacterium]|nr:succinate dehydrogenase cytochrome b subunit [Acidimicrobiia bacterium]
MTTTEKPKRPAPLPIRFYRSALGKKWVMAVTGIVLIGYVIAHLIGNLKVYLGAEEINSYAEALRDLGGAIAPRTSLLWLMRAGLIVAFVLHVHAAYSLTYTNWKARGAKYRERDYAVADYASRTMRWSGTIVLLFIVFHLGDLTWGAQPAAVGEWVRGDVYSNLILSMERPLSAAIYAVANIALGFHLYHGVWSLFQSVGWNHPNFNTWRRLFAYAVTGFVVIGNLSFPIAVQTGVLELGG